MPLIFQRFFCNAYDLSIFFLALIKLQTKIISTMKKLNVLLMMFMVIVVSSITFANTNPGDEKGYTLMTVAEIKATYGEDAIRAISSLELLDTDVVAITVNPCGGEQLCGSALAQARVQAQQLANACCCVQYFGVICCEPGTGAILQIEGISMPKNCN
jgi:hypothetical protein